MIQALAMVIDAHCHLEREYYGDELDAVIERAWDAGLSHIIAVGASRVIDGAAEAIALAERQQRIFATAGIHPHEAQHADRSAMKMVEGHLAHPKVVALGEVGLDFHYDNSPRDQQRAVFRLFCQMARDNDIPIMLHVREAHDECCQIIDEVGLSGKGGVVHCFSAGPEEAQQYLARGLHLSIPGIVTFKKAAALHQAVAETPLDRLMVETDAPYLAPIPHRGKRNEPAFVVHTAARVAEIKGVSPEKLHHATTQNTLRVFGIER